MYPSLDLLDHARPILGPKRFALWIQDHKGKLWYAGICLAYRVYDIIVIEQNIDYTMFDLLDSIKIVFLARMSKAPHSFDTDSMEYVFENWKYRIERDIEYLDGATLYIRSEQ